MGKRFMGAVALLCGLGAVGIASAQTDVIYATGVSQMAGNSSWQFIVRSLGDPGCAGACACDNSNSAHDVDTATRRYLQVDNFAPYTIPDLHRITGVRFNVLTRYAGTDILDTSRLRLYVQTSTYASPQTCTEAYESGNASAPGQVCYKSAFETQEWGSDTGACRWRDWEAGGTNADDLDVYTHMPIPDPGGRWTEDTVNRLVFGVRAAGNNVDELLINGFRLTVTHEYACGNGDVDGKGEQCDLGASNGTPGACCSATCQLVTAGTPCRTAAGVCDVTETCTGGSPTCPADGFVSGGICRPASGACDAAESCNGSGPACPADGGAPNGTPCSDGNACTQTDTCQGGGCVGANPVVCSAGQCFVPGTCNPGTGACSAPTPKPNGSSCDDGVPCTSGDACQEGLCVPTVPCPCDHDGVVEPGEECDDGNAMGQDGCSADCRWEGHCGSTCSAQVCDEDADCPPGCEPCTRCGDGVVGGGEGCDDGNRTPDDGCSDDCEVEPPPFCGPTPAVGCRRPLSPAKSSILLQDRIPDKGDQVKWKWTKGAATLKSDFGNPLTTTNYTVCVYDSVAGSPVLRLRASIPAGGLCAGRPCWKETGRGFKYADKDATPDGIAKLSLGEGLAGNAKVSLGGKGVPLPMPTLPLSQANTVVVQIKNSDGQCWDAAFSTPAQVNVQGQFRDKSD